VIHRYLALTSVVVHELNLALSRQKPHLKGAVAALDRTQEVGGSSPPSSTSDARYTSVTTSPGATLELSQVFGEPEDAPPRRIRANRSASPVSGRRAH
jgi:hypothetical protein